LAPEIAVFQIQKEHFSLYSQPDPVLGLARHLKIVVGINGLFRTNKAWPSLLFAAMA
jgi:hypothetical protein